MPDRARRLNDRPRASGQGPVVYWMSRDQRINDNPALAEAQKIAIESKSPLVVVFVIYPKIKFATRAHYRFMIEGLKETEHELNSLGIGFAVIDGSKWKQWINEHKPTSIVSDYSPLRGPKRIKKEIANEVTCEVIEVDAHNVVPVWIASNKQEWGARTIRPKLHKLWNEYLVEPTRIRPHIVVSPRHIHEDWEEILSKCGIKEEDGYRVSCQPGEKAGLSVLRDFIAKRFERYEEDRNDPGLAATSQLSAYLHFGQVASIRVALEVLKAVKKNPKLKKNADALIEEILVRKELADNYCEYQPEYDSIKGAPDWAQKTLDKHLNDKRQYLYSLGQLRRAKTHDEFWNSAQIELTRTGVMAGYMRMYWAKKILEWSPSAEKAIKRAIELNNTYQLDGRDPNGYVGVMWAIAGLHDRPWAEREIFGMVRYMNQAGLDKKFNMIRYKALVESKTR